MQHPFVSQAVRRCCLAALAALVCNGFLSAGEVVVKEKYGLSFTLPDGFVANPALVNAIPVLDAAYSLPTADGSLGPSIMVEPLPGLIGREPIPVSPDVNRTLSKMGWNGFDVDVIRIREQTEQGEFINYNVALPLKPKAIQFRFLAASAQEEELKRILRDTISSVRGASNWSDPEPIRIFPRSLSPAYRMGIAAGIVIGGLIGLIFLRPRIQRGGVFMLSGILWVCGFLADAGNSTDLLLLKGSATMLGFGGVILGIVDYFLPRADPAPEAVVAPIAPLPPPPDAATGQPPVRPPAPGSDG